MNRLPSRRLTWNVKTYFPSEKKKKKKKKKEKEKIGCRLLQILLSAVIPLDSRFQTC